MYIVCYLLGCVAGAVCCYLWLRSYRNLRADVLQLDKDYLQKEIHRLRMQVSDIIGRN